MFSIYLKQTRTNGYHITRPYGCIQRHLFQIRLLFAARNRNFTLRRAQTKAAGNGNGFFDGQSIAIFVAPRVSYLPMQIDVLENILNQFDLANGDHITRQYILGQIRRQFETAGLTAPVG